MGYPIFGRQVLVLDGLVLELVRDELVQYVSGLDELIQYVSGLDELVQFVTVAMCLWEDKLTVSTSRHIAC